MSISEVGGAWVWNETLRKHVLVDPAKFIAGYVPPAVTDVATDPAFENYRNACRAAATADHLRVVKALKAIRVLINDAIGPEAQ